MSIIVCVYAKFMWELRRTGSQRKARRKSASARISCAQCAAVVVVRHTVRSLMSQDIAGVFAGRPDDQADQHNDEDECLRTFLSWPNGGLPPSWMTRCRRETPTTTTMTKRTKKTKGARRGTMSRQSSGNPNPTNSRQPL